MGEFMSSLFPISAIFAGTISVMALSATMATAQCSPTSVPAGGTINCSGTETTEIDDGSDNITINLDNTAKIIVDEDRGIDFGGDGVTVNVGTGLPSTAEVTSTDSDAIRLEGANGMVTNYGTINGDDEGLQAADAGGHTVLNYGDILAGDKAVMLGDDSSLTNFSDASISAPADEGVEAGDNFTLVNEAGASITGFDDAVQAGLNASIDNYGLIENVGPSGPDAQDAVDIDSGTVTNHIGAIIKSTNDAAIDFDEDDGSGATIVNYGLITGTKGIEVELGPVDPANVSGQDVINHGTLIGTAGFATILGEGEDSFTWKAGSLVTGVIDLGGDNDLFSMDGPVSFAERILVDGGLGIDTAKFGGADLSNLAGASLTGDVLDLNLTGSGWDVDVSLTSFESFFLGSESFSAAALVAAAPTPVPLPAGGLLLFSAVGLLAWHRRRPTD